MNEQTGAPRVADRSDPSVRRRRLDALQRAHRAKRILEHEAEMAQRYGVGAVRVTAPTGTPDPGREGEEGAAAAPRANSVYLEDVGRVQAIHHELQHERKAARRPFHRHAERLVLALELAERLALERLGFDDFADFEARGSEQPPGRDIIDLAYLELAAHDLGDAEATLAELDDLEADGNPRPGAAPPAVAPRWSVHPALRADGRTRPTRARRKLFGPLAGEGAAPVAPIRVDAIWGDGDRNVDPVAVAPLPMRLRRTPHGHRDERVDGGDDGTEVLGEIVHDGRPIRVQKLPGVAYSDDDDSTGSGLRPDSIVYGDPRWLN